MKPSPELIKLVDKCLAQNISRIEMAQLEVLLCNETARQYYLEMVGIEADLPIALGAKLETMPTSSIFTLRPLTLAAAALVIFSIGLFSGKKLFSLPSNLSESRIEAINQPQTTSSTSASITSLIGVTWEGEAPSSIQLSSDSDPIALKSGLMELTFASGVRSLIEGPAIIRVTGNNAAELSSGRMVADVPKGAEGFTVNYPDGKVIDLGTEFAINVPQNQNGAEIGVYRGEVEVYDHQSKHPLKIIENHAVTQTSEAAQPFASIPFKRDDYIRKLPSKEFSWSYPESPTSTPHIMEFDVSHLIWQSGDYRAVVKWMHGSHALNVLKADLLFNGQIIASDHHQGCTGQIQLSHDNTYTFSVAEHQQHQDHKGRWTLQLTTQVMHGTSSQQIAKSSGILLFEASHSLHEKEKAFLGTWQYRHDGKVISRTFTADHRAQLSVDGKMTQHLAEATWKVENGILILDNPAGINGEPKDIQEFHLCSKDGKLIFINRPYRNADKVE